jgi:hypothetical protein
MFEEINKNTINNLIEYLIPILEKDTQNIAYERSLFYILNAVRRGGFFYYDDNFFLVFAKSYDKPDTLSLIFFNKPEVFDKLFKELLKSNLLKNTEVFIHHLFKKTIDKLKREFPYSLVVDENTAKKINAYPPEDNYPQIIYDLTSLPRFQNSTFRKIMYLYDKLEKCEGGFKQSIFEYFNKAKKPLNEPEIITVVITDKTPYPVRTFISYVFKKIFKNWLGEKNIPKEIEQYYSEALKNLFSLLTDSTILSKVQSQIIFRAHFDINLEKGGLWIGEFIPHKSLFIPHILLTDYYYKNQYVYLIWDMILYCYTKNFMRINIGGCEEEELFNIKKAPEDLLGDKVKERKLYTLYILSNRNGLRL